MELVELLQLTIKEKASDLLIAAGIPPVIRVDGQLIRTRNAEMSPDECRRLIYSVLTEQQKGRFERDKELDFSLSVAGLARFRVNVHMQRGSVATAIRTIAHHIPGIDDLGLPRVIYELSRKQIGRASCRERV